MELENGLCAFVQHIYLLDLNARGYVRPISISYLSTEQSKIFSQFPIFLNEMALVSRTLKAVNHKIFSSDLKKRLADLLLTESALKHSRLGCSPAVRLAAGISPTPNAVRECIDDLWVLHKRIEHQQDQENEQNMKKFTADILDGNLSHVPPDVLQQALPGLICGTQNSSGTTQPAYTPKVLETLHRGGSIYTRTLRPIQELCGENWEKGVDQLKALLFRMRKSELVLYLEDHDSHLLRRRETLLSMGNNAVLNFNLLPNQQNKSQLLAAWKNLHVETCNLDVSLVPKANESPTDSGGDLSSGFSSFDSFSIDTRGPKEGGELKNVLSISEKSSSESLITEKKVPKITITTRKPGSSRNGEDDHEKARTELEEGRKKDVHGKKEEKENIVQPTEKIENFSNTLWGFSETNAGVGLLDFKKQCYSWSPHLIFSLLKGRPVFIISQDEEYTRNVVQALSIFVVSSGNPDSTEVIHWYTGPSISLSLLTKGVKLIGLKEHKSISCSVSKYVSVLDLDQKTLVSPRYKEGSFIHLIFQREDYWPHQDEFTYLAYIHSLLYEWSMTACLYYHCCCVGVPPQGQVVPSREPQQQARLRRSNSHSNSRSHTNIRTVASYSTLLLKDMEKSETPFKTWSNISVAEATQEDMKQRQEKKNEWTKINETFWKENGIKESDREIIQYLAHMISVQQVNLHRDKKQLMQLIKAQKEHNANTSSPRTPGSSSASSPVTNHRMGHGSDMVEENRRREDREKGLPVLPNTIRLDYSQVFFFKNNVPNKRD
eukprot:TRINITY_DN3283_c0_g1_i1.p1 TRINITY_DN3283_c0_g1~~TRINITY_DN3283_c0_g1_i1.p1  ORF type:complete len:853 (+),score=159.08 TRINITY_DN3283_c0_g1_i1:237-2561(+)